jgi:hypothetical protein
MAFAAGDMKILFEQPVGWRPLTDILGTALPGPAWYTWAAASEADKARVQSFNVDCANV